MGRGDGSQVQVADRSGIEDHGSRIEDCALDPFWIRAETKNYAHLDLDDPGA